MIVFIYKWRKKYVFLTKHAHAGAFAAAGGALFVHNVAIE